MMLRCVLDGIQSVNHGLLLSPFVCVRARDVRTKSCSGLSGSKGTATDQVGVLSDIPKPKNDTCSTAVYSTGFPCHNNQVGGRYGSYTMAYSRSTHVVGRQHLNTIPRLRHGRPF